MMINILQNNNERINYLNKPEYLLRATKTKMALFLLDLMKQIRLSLMDSIKVLLIQKHKTSNLF